MTDIYFATFLQNFEKLLQINSIKILTKHNIISFCHHRFQENKPTNDASCNHLQNHKVINKSTLGIFTDLKKPFDTVD